MTCEIDSCPNLARKETENLFGGNRSSGYFLVEGSLWSRDHSAVRSLNALCDLGYVGSDTSELLTAGHRATTLENLPSATQSVNEWNTRHQEDTFENLAVAGRTPANEYSPASQSSPLVIEMAHRPANEYSPASQSSPLVIEMSHRPANEYSPASQSSPLVIEMAHRPANEYSPPSQSSHLIIEMAREIEHLKSELAALQSVNRNESCSREHGGGLIRDGNLMDERDRQDVLSDHVLSPLIPPKSDVGSLWLISSMSPLSGKRLEEQVLRDSSDHDGRIVWSGGAGIEQDRLDVNNLPLVMELRARVARLHDQLKSVTAVKPSEDASLNVTTLLEKNPASENIPAESETVSHLRRVIQVRSLARPASR